jgi:hypothetical protein
MTMRRTRAAIFFVLVGEPNIDDPDQRAANMRKMVELRDALNEVASTRPIAFRLALIKRANEFTHYSVPKDIALAASGGRLPLIYVNVTYESAFDVAELEDIERRFGLIYAGELDTSNHFVKKR